MKRIVKKSNCNCYYGGKTGCKFKKSCNFPSCKFFTTEIPDKPIESYKEYLKKKKEIIIKNREINEKLKRR